ncbi:MAG: TrkA family potassium uptake protein, partial [Clostridia bacterium]|nr:TrkA family potassium uptake protein [Clostridia bacterium]
MKSILIIGAGQFGFDVAKKLNELRCEVMAVDIAEENVKAVLPYVTDALIGDGTDAEFLNSLGVKDYDVCIVALGGLFQSSLETTSLLKELGANKVITRAKNDVQMKFLLKNGADEVVYPEKQTAIRIATKCARESILDFIELDGNHAICEVAIPKDWLGKELSEIGIRKKYGINIITVKRGGSVFVPSGSTVFETDDIAFVIGENENL